MQQHHVNPDGLPPVRGYSQAVRFSGDVIVVSGQVPLDPQGRLVGAGDPKAQMLQVFENLRIALAAAGAGMEHVIKLTVYLTDLADLAAFRQVRDEYVSLDTPPASSLVQVKGLIDPNFCVEIEALAVGLATGPNATAKLQGAEMLSRQSGEPWLGTDSASPGRAAGSPIRRVQGRRRSSR